MSSSEQPLQRSTGLIWLLLLLFLLLILLIVWLGTGLGFNQNQPIGNLRITEPIAAGIIIPTETPISIQLPAETGAVPSSELVNNVPDDFETGDNTSPIQGIQLQPNQMVVVADKATFGSAGRLPLYADHDTNSSVLTVYSAGVALRVLDVSSDYDQYPIEVNGVTWVRVQDGNGLAGWVDATMIQSAGVPASSSVAPAVLDVAPAPTTASAEEAPADDTPASVNTAIPSLDISPTQAPEPTATSTPAG